MEQLPSEILQKITSFVDPDSRRMLRLTSRKMKSNVDSRAEYTNIITKRDEVTYNLVNLVNADFYRRILTDLPILTKFIPNNPVVNIIGDFLSPFDMLGESRIVIDAKKPDGHYYGFFSVTYYIGDLKKMVIEGSFDRLSKLDGYYCIDIFNENGKKEMLYLFFQNGNVTGRFVILQRHGEIDFIQVGYFDDLGRIFSIDCYQFHQIGDEEIITIFKNGSIPPGNIIVMTSLFAYQQNGFDRLIEKLEPDENDRIVINRYLENYYYSNDGLIILRISDDNVSKVFDRNGDVYGHGDIGDGPARKDPQYFFNMLDNLITKLMEIKPEMEGKRERVYSFIYNLSNPSKYLFHFLIDLPSGLEMVGLEVSA